MSVTLYDPKTGDPFVLPLTANIGYYIKKGFLTQKPILKKEEAPSMQNIKETLPKRKGRKPRAKVSNNDN